MVAEVKRTDDEAELKSQIRALEKKIVNKQAHIEKLQDELRDLKAEQFTLKQMRIELLKRELDGDGIAVSKGLKVAAEA